MNTLASVIAIAIIVALQVFLSKQKNKWLGLIIPIINTLVAILYVLNTMTISAAIMVFLLMMIPTAINLGIYFACRKEFKEKNIDEITKMKISDL
jgi:energy-coupling factor transporter transmembrane protein EcfT